LQVVLCTFWTPDPAQAFLHEGFHVGLQYTQNIAVRYRWHVVFEVSLSKPVNREFERRLVGAVAAPRVFRMMGGSGGDYWGRGFDRGFVEAVVGRGFTHDDPG